MTNTQLIAQHIPVEYGKVKEWAVEVINNDKSIFNDGKLMRFVGIEEYINAGYQTDDSLFTIETATIPPAYRKETGICFMPNFGMHI